MEMHPSQVKMQERIRHIFKTLKESAVDNQMTLEQARGLICLNFGVSDRKLKEYLKILSGLDYIKIENGIIYIK